MIIGKNFNSWVKVLKAKENYGEKLTLFLRHLPRRCTMSSCKRLCIWAAIMFSGLITFVPITQAQQSIDMMSCGDATLTTIVASQELTIMSFEAKGINID